MNVKAVECPVCGDKVYSRCEGDEQRCCCGFATISGGPKEPVLSPMLNETELIDLDVPADEDQLFWDWNLKEDKFGIISEFAADIESHLE